MPSVLPVAQRFHFQTIGQTPYINMLDFSACFESASERANAKFYQQDPIGTFTLTLSAGMYTECCPAAFTTFDLAFFNTLSFSILKRNTNTLLSSVTLCGPPPFASHFSSFRRCRQVSNPLVPENKKERK
uniref:Uncharacterized protein n=1 Tax=Caenorhabditis japonica TaxID=281687 RepID=A0A8R1IVE6_CAEJA